MLNVPEASDMHSELVIDMSVPTSDNNSSSLEVDKELTESTNNHPISENNADSSFHHTDNEAQSSETGSSSHADEDSDPGLSRESTISEEFANSTSAKPSFSLSGNASSTKRILFLFRHHKSHTVIKKHGLKEYRCPVCNTDYKQKFSLKRHFLRSHVNIKYLSAGDISNCKINVKDKVYKREVQKALKTSNGRRKFKSGGEVFLDNNESRLMTGLYKCHICPGIVFDLEAELREHFSKHAGDKKKFSCDQCDAIFSKRQGLSKHLVNHDEKSNSFTCKKCSRTFSTKQKLEKHLTTHINRNCCRYCFKLFSNAANTRRHEALHEGIKAFHCSICMVAFSQKKDLDRHLRKQHIEICFPCRMCPRAFITKVDLKTHLSQKHIDAVPKKPNTDSSIAESPPSSTPAVLPPIKLNICVACGRAFPTLPALVDHQAKAHPLLARKRKAHRKQVTQRVKLVKQAKRTANLPKKVNKFQKFGRGLQKQGKTPKHSKKGPKQHGKVAKKIGRPLKKPEKSATRVSSRKERTRKSESELKHLQEKADVEFYSNVSMNIAENLVNYIDGKTSQLSLKEYNFSDHYEPPNHYSELNQFPWSLYNFPSSFDADSALQSRGQEVKLKSAENLSARDRCLLATGLNKVNAPIVVADANVNQDSVINLSNGVSQVDCCNTSDLPEYNYNSDMSLEERKKLIGLEVPKRFVCYVCKDISDSYPDFLIHFTNNHPNVELSCLELEGEKNLPPIVPEEICTQYINPDGVLFSCNVPPLIYESQLVKCTKCHSEFKTSSDLYIHLIECGGKRNDVSTYIRKSSHQKRIKRTMKNRLDFTVKKNKIHKPADKIPEFKEKALKKNDENLSEEDVLSNENVSKTNEKSQFYKNGRLKTTSLKCDKNYFNTKPKKSGRTGRKNFIPSPLKRKTVTLQSTSKVECSLCHRTFGAIALLKNHMVFCSQNRLKNINGKDEFVIPPEINDTSSVLSIQGSRNSSLAELERLSNSINTSEEKTSSNHNISFNAALPNSDVHLQSPVKATEKLIELRNSQQAIDGSCSSENAVDLTTRTRGTHVPPSLLGNNYAQFYKKGSALEKAINAVKEFNLKQDENQPRQSSLDETVNRLTRDLNNKSNSFEDCSDSKINKENKSRRSRKPTKSVRKIYDRSLLIPDDNESSPSTDHTVRDSHSFGAEGDESATSVVPSSSNVLESIDSPELKKTNHTANDSNEVPVLFGKNSDVSKRQSELTDKELPPRTKEVSPIVEEMSTVVKEVPPVVKDMSPIIKEMTSFQTNCLAPVGQVCSSEHLSGKESINFLRQTINDKMKNATQHLNKSEVPSKVNTSNNSVTAGISKPEEASSKSKLVDRTENILETLPNLQNSNFELPTSLSVNSDQSGSSQDRNSPSLEVILSSINERLHTSEFDPPLSASWLEDEKFDIPSSRNKLNLSHTSEAHGPLIGIESLNFALIPASNNIGDKSIVDGASVAAAAADAHKSENQSLIKDLIPSGEESLPFETSTPIITRPTSVFPPQSALMVKKSQDTATAITNSLPEEENLKASKHSLESSPLKENVCASAGETSSSFISNQQVVLESSDLVLGKESMTGTTDNIPASPVNNNEVASSKEISIACKENNTNTKNNAPLNIPFSSVIKPRGRPGRKPRSMKNLICDRKKEEKLSNGDLHPPNVSKNIVAGQNKRGRKKKKQREDHNAVDFERKSRNLALIGNDSSNKNCVSESSEPLPSTASDKDSKSQPSELASPPSKLSTSTTSSLRSFRKKGRPAKDAVISSSTRKTRANCLEEDSAKFSPKPSRRVKEKISHTVISPALSQDDHRIADISVIKAAFDFSSFSTTTGECPSVNGNHVAKEIGEQSDCTMKNELDQETKKYSCPYCMLEFAYLTNFKRHVPMCKQRSCTTATQPNSTAVPGAQPNSTSAITEQSKCTLALQFKPKKEESEDIMLPEFEQYDIIKSEQEKDEEKKHSCPYCMLEFAYLTNFRRHIKTCKECPKKEAEAIPSTSSTQLQYLPKKDEVEESMLNLLRHQSRQAQMMKEAGKDDGKNHGLNTYSCNTCHRIYLSLFKLLQHQVVHKLNQTEDVGDSDRSLALENSESHPNVSGGSTAACGVERISEPSNNVDETCGDNVEQKYPVSERTSSNPSSIQNNCLLRNDDTGKIKCEKSDTLKQGQEGSSSKVVESLEASKKNEKNPGDTALKFVRVPSCENVESNVLTFKPLAKNYVSKVAKNIANDENTPNFSTDDIKPDDQSLENAKADSISPAPLTWSRKKKKRGRPKMLVKNETVLKRKSVDEKVEMGLRKVKRKPGRIPLKKIPEKIITPKLQEADIIAKKETVVDATRDESSNILDKKFMKTVSSPLKRRHYKTITGKTSAVSKLKERVRKIKEKIKFIPKRSCNITVPTKEPNIESVQNDIPTLPPPIKDLNKPLLKRIISKVDSGDVKTAEISPVTEPVVKKRGRKPMSAKNLTNTPFSSQSKLGSEKKKFVSSIEVGKSAVPGFSSTTRSEGNNLGKSPVSVNPSRGRPPKSAATPFQSPSSSEMNTQCQLYASGSTSKGRLSNTSLTEAKSLGHLSASGNTSKGRPSSTSPAEAKRIGQSTGSGSVSRGRPPKVVMPALSNTSSSDVNNLGQPSSSGSSTRGRPSASPAEIKALSQSSASGSGNRGRPPKVIPAFPSTSRAGMSNLSQPTASGSTTRGRPPKIARSLIAAVNSSDDESDFVEEKVKVKKALNKRQCPVCRKIFCTTLYRNRHVQLCHGVTSDAVKSDQISPDIPKQKKKRKTKGVKNRWVFQRQCKKPSPPIHKRGPKSSSFIEPLLKRRKL